MCVLLHLLPDPVPREIQPAAAQEEDIVHELSEGKDPFLCPHRPGLRLGRFPRGVPPANADDAAGRQFDLAVGLDVGGSAAHSGNGDGTAAVDAIVEMGRERSCVPLDVKLSTTIIDCSLSLDTGVALGNGSSYLGRIVKCPSEVRVVGKGSLHAVYSTGNVGLGQWNHLD